jgi:hypothetical protein
MSTGASRIGSISDGRRGDKAGDARKEDLMNPASTAPRKTGRTKRLILAVSAAAGLLALGAPVAAQASSHPAPNAAAVTRTAPEHVTLTAATLQVGDLNGAYDWPLGSCYFDVGDRYEGNPGGAAVGMATISCPTEHTYRIKVFLDYWNGSNTVTATENVNGTPQYGYKASVATGCDENVYHPYWITYAQVSIDGDPYSGFYNSPYGSYQAGPYCR